MRRNEFSGIRYDDPDLQAAFERLLAGVEAAERSRVPVQQRHTEAERDLEDGVISETQFRQIDSAFISENNNIAAAKRKVDQFLQQNKNYRVDR